MNGAKAMRAQYKALALLKLVLGLKMVTAAILGTPNSVFAASALEEEAVVLIGALLGFFANTDDE